MTSRKNLFLALVRKRVATGDNLMAIAEAWRDGMQIVGERFSRQEYFVSELITSG